MTPPLLGLLIVLVFIANPLDSRPSKSQGMQPPGKGLNRSGSDAPVQVSPASPLAVPSTLWSLAQAFKSKTSKARKR